MASRRLVLAGMIAFLCAALGGLAACGGETADESRADPEALRDLAGAVDFGGVRAGGAFRIAVTELALTGAFDPTAEYSSRGWSLYALMLRPLLGTRRTAGLPGNELVPDLASDLPRVSGDRRTYTFTLRPGVRFGPPVSREVTSRDVAYAFERIATPALSAQYAFYYEVIEGFSAFSEGAADHISGIGTPDDRTISFRLSSPAGDFPYRLALPATAPIPEEVARCHARPGAYGRHVIASGPYMIEGSELLDVSSCDAQRPLSGYRPLRRLSLVRNPAHDPTTEAQGMRESLPDRILVTTNTNIRDIFARIERGQLEASLEQPPAAVVRERLARDEGRERLRVNRADRLLYLSMNLTVPPFDDVHVRRALNAAMDLDALRRAWGGPVSGEIATDVLPDSVIAGRLPTATYRPHQGGALRGDLAAARRQMARSRYDADGDGRCDAGACSDVPAVSTSIAPYDTMTPIIREAAAAIGIDLAVREPPPDTAAALALTPSRGIGLAANMGFGKDFPDPSSFMNLFSSRTIVPRGNLNTALVGITEEQAGALGIELPSAVPSVDAGIEACAALAGAERTGCYVALDRRITEQVVPWVPYLDANNIDVLGPAVTAYDYDQFAGTIALTHVAVDPDLQRR